MKLLKILTLIFIVGCSNIKMLSDQEIYKKDFLDRFEKIQSIYNKGQVSRAKKELLAIDDETISDAARGKKYNFLGLIAFGQKSFTIADQYFTRALSHISQDQRLLQQARLNLASTRYKLGAHDSAWGQHSQVDPEVLSEGEKRNYYQLQFILAQKLDRKRDIVLSAGNLLGGAQSIGQIRSSEYNGSLIGAFRKLSDSDRVGLLDSNLNPYVVAYLALDEAGQRYYRGDKDGAKEVAQWLQSKHSDIPEVLSFSETFFAQLENSSKMKMNQIGLVLPLTGEKSRFGRLALRGIEVGMKSGDRKLLLNVRNSVNNPQVAREKVRELIQTKYVSVVIGGLFPTTASEEYLEARRHGVLFISLSHVNLPNQLKNHLLVEVPGSIQSQIAALFSGQFLDKYGRKVAIVYPSSKRGEAYVEELWGLSNRGEVEVTGFYPYDENDSDFRPVVKRALGLGHKNERLEELEVWKNIYALENKKTTIRRIQTLRPVIDFDWVFVPSYPNQAINIINSFNYFDANGVLFVGGPSWMSRRLVNEQKNLGKLMFTGDSLNDFDQDFINRFVKVHGSKPGLVETLGYEGANIAVQLIGSSEFARREELEKQVLNKGSIDGVTGSWNFTSGVWIKKLDILKMSRRKVEKATLFVPMPDTKNDPGQVIQTKKAESQKKTRL